MTGRFTDLREGTPPRLKWPVACWRSPSVSPIAPSEFYVPSPIPPFALVDLGHEMVGAGGTLGYDTGDISRGQRGRIAGANDFFHAAWDESRRSMFIASANASSAYYFGHKTTGVCTASTEPAWNQRIYGAWPLLRDGAPYGRLDKRAGRSFVPSGVQSILRKKWFSPWVRAGAFPLAMSWPIQNISHRDEPAFVQLWGRCLDQDQGFQTGDVMLLGGDDIGAASTGQTVWNSGAAIGFAVAAAGLCGLSSVGAPVNLTSAKWEYQLRAAFASPVDDLVDVRRLRNGGDLVSMFYSPWRRIGAVGELIPFRLPENFDPVEIGISIRCIQPVGGWVPGDQCYSRSGGNLTSYSYPQVLLRGLCAYLQAPNANYSTIAKDGSGAGAALGPSFEVQLRAIG